MTRARKRPRPPKEHETHEPEVVRLTERIEGQSDEEAIKTLEALPRAVAGEVLDHLEPERASELLARLKGAEAADLLEEMWPDNAVDVLEALPEGKRAELLRLLQRTAPKEAELLRRLRQYPPDTAGGLMSPDVVALPEHLTVEEAIQELRRLADEAEVLYYAYVVDRDGKLLGVLSMRDLILSDPKTPIRDIMYRDVVTVPVDLDAEEVARIFDKYH